MNQLKVGERFVVFDGVDPSLLCYVDAILKDGDWRCKVINGAWSFIMTPNTGHAAWVAPGGSHQMVFNWMPLSHIPGVPKGDYNEVLEYIQNSGYRVGQRTPLKLYALDLWLRVVAGARRFKEASRAFYVVLTGAGIVKPVELEDPEDEEEDEIPF